MPTPIAHRVLDDGSRDSVCLGCLMTLANSFSVENETELEVIETKHVCVDFGEHLVTLLLCELDGWLIGLSESVEEMFQTTPQPAH